VPWTNHVPDLDPVLFVRACHPQQEYLRK